MSRTTALLFGSRSQACQLTAGLRVCSAYCLPQSLSVIASSCRLAARGADLWVTNRQRWGLCHTSMFGALCRCVLGFNASATARVISRRWNNDGDEIGFLVEETGVPGGNHRPTANNWRNFFTHTATAQSGDWTWAAAVWSKVGGGGGGFISNWNGNG